MGQIASFITRKINRFNVENRAYRVLDKEKPSPAPKFASNLEDMKRTLKVDPIFLQNLHKKDEALDDRLKNVYVNSKNIIYNDINRKTNDSSDKLPTNRNTSEDFEFGYLEPKQVKAGHCTLRQAVKFITEHQTNPNDWNVAKIAHEYKVDVSVVENILRFYKGYNLYIPDHTSRNAVVSKENMIVDKKPVESLK